MKIFVYGFVRIDRDLCSSCKKIRISKVYLDAYMGGGERELRNRQSDLCVGLFKISVSKTSNSREKQNTIQDACPSSTWTQSVLCPINIEPMLSMDSTIYLLDLAGSIRLNESQANPTKTAIGEN
jgi:hypothetical protein